MALGADILILAERNIGFDILTLVIMGDIFGVRRVTEITGFSTVRLIKLVGMLE